MIHKPMHPRVVATFFKKTIENHYFLDNIYIG